MTTASGAETREQFYRRYLLTAVPLSESDDVASVLMALDDVQAGIEEKLKGMNLPQERLNSELDAVNFAAHRLRQELLDAGAEPPSFAAPAPAAVPVVEDEPQVVAAPPAVQPVVPAKSKSTLLSRRTLLEGTAGLLLGVPGVLWWWKASQNWVQPTSTNGVRVAFSDHLELLGGWHPPEVPHAWAQKPTARIKFLRSDPSLNTIKLTFVFHGVGNRPQDVTVTTTEGTPQVARLSNDGKMAERSTLLRWPAGATSILIDIATDPMVSPSTYGSPDKRLLGVGIRGAVSL